MNVLMITTEWPTPDQPHRVPFLTRQVELLKSGGINIHVFHFEGKKDPINYLKAYQKVRALIKTGNFNIVHAQWGQSALPALGSGLPMVVTFRGSDLFGIANTDGSYSWKGKILQVISRGVARNADHIILVSEKMRSKLPVLTGKEISIIPSGINLSLFQPMAKVDCRKQLGLAEDKKLVLFGGDPDRTDKRFYLANEALNLVKENLNVDFLKVKSVPQSQMPIYLNAADVVLLTSKHEGSPNIVKEALACNRPVVSVDVGDVSERLANLSGCWVVVDSPLAIAESLTKVLNSTESYDYRNAVLPLDENIVTDRIIEIYNGMST
ncbi:MAG TPA: glycosyltransferase [Cyclobacteriaceae bacterium]|nr:glycosyltransferase [Cyclobacteriaceae bacterium]HRJ83282.1 glycosyltransferase [Cyclobacteriaceae bacterium]